MKQLNFDYIGKICTKCRKWKPLDYFHKHPSGKYGRRPTCKSCRSVPKTHYQLEHRKLKKLGFRQCKRCKQVKSLKDFQVHGRRQNKYHICKDCMYPDRLRIQERNRLFQEGKKRCNTCDVIKSLDEFYFRVDREMYEFECKTCHNNRAREYDARNPEKKRTRNKRWAAKQLAKDPEYFRKKYAETRDMQLLRHREYCSEHSEQLRAYSRRYYKENREKVLAYQRKYNAKYPNKSRARKIIRRTWKTEVGGSFTAEEWQALCETYGNRCLRCGANDKPLTVDHIIPVSKGGSSDIENLQPLCKSCNCQKHDKTIDYRYNR